MEKTSRKLIVVLGMHRSGTSTVTRGLQVLGANVGENLLSPAPDNPKGYWEDVDITELNVEMLRAVNSDWHHLTPIEAVDVEVLRKKGYFLRAVDLLRQKVSCAPVFAFKDPRIAKLWPFWKDVFDFCQFEMNFVIAIRHPLSVVNSLARRNSFDAEKSFFLWLEYVLSILLGTVGEQRIFVDYDCLLQSPDYELNRIAQRFDLEIDQRELESYTAEFLQKDLRHTVYELSDLVLHDSSPPIVNNIYKVLHDIALDKLGPDDSVLKNHVNEWKGEYRNLRPLMMLVDKLWLDRENTKAELESQNDSSQQALGEITKQTERVKEVLVARESQIASLNEELIDRDGQIAKLNQSIIDQISHIKTLNEEIVDSGHQISDINQLLISRDRQIASFENALQEQRAQNDIMYRAITKNAFVKLGCRLYNLSYRKISEYHKLSRATKKAPLFDAKWYLEQYPDAGMSKYSPLCHYFYFGAEEGRDPNPYFDTQWYLKEYPDVANSGMNPLLHYLKQGVEEGRNPNPYFSTNWYLKEYPDVATSALNPLLHYIEHGIEEGRTPNPYFNCRWYLMVNQDVASSSMSAFFHFVRHGAEERRDPNPYFDTSWYSERYPDVVNSGLSPFLHFLKYGVEERRDPNPYFDTSWYSERYPDVANSGLSPFLHFLKYGVEEGRDPNPYFDTSWYSEKYPDVANSGLSPFLHFLKYGVEERRDPNPYFDTIYYLEKNPDVANSGLSPLLHYKNYGGKEGRSPGPYFDTSWYLNEYSDVAQSGLEPLHHYFKYGAKQFRDTFNAPWRQRSTLPITPHYIDPKLEVEGVTHIKGNPTIAIHIHLYDLETLSEFVSRLKPLKIMYDVYVSVFEGTDIQQVTDVLKGELVEVGKVIVETAPSKGQDIGPLIVQFGKRLAHYDIFAHFHTLKDSYKAKSTTLYSASLDTLLGSLEKSSGRIEYIIGLLQANAKVVYAQSNNNNIRDRSGWCGNKELAKGLLEQHTSLSIDDFPVIDFPESAMFWARTECLKDYLQLPICYDDFSVENSYENDTLVQVLRRLVLVFAYNHKGENICLHNDNSIYDYRYYEPQQDYSNGIIHQDIKLLSYYLPQFLPIPENDLWHGEGFTEWTNVISANPLFRGHYQQHIPHSDTGYYLLDSPAVLKKQAEQMRKSGVYGQVFYHYWFTGKLILESAAKMLLDNPDVEMPFCFCWANENWTRRWDGNENEILLGQDYSADDARAFIRYLIPFFSDPRYIRIEDRPVLYVYRPASIPNAQEYIDIWEKECMDHGIPAPYVVAVLTRGATDPKDFGMDAGVERVLHDWTGGVVPDMRERLYAYSTLKGSVLPYDEVSDFYSCQSAPKKFTYFRSLVPTFDNTARYGEDAILLHHSTPGKFQDWLEKIVKYSKANLPEDKRFVLVNAWNEWAEGAHLEPDTFFGYSYLNSVGRVLSGIAYGADFKPISTLPAGVRIHLFFSEDILKQLRVDLELKNRFLLTLQKSSVFNVCDFSTNVPELFEEFLPNIKNNIKEVDYVLEIRCISFFDSFVIEKMIKKIFSSRKSTIITNAYGMNSPLVKVASNGSVELFEAYDTPLILSTTDCLENGYKNVKMITDAHSFVTIPQSQKLNDVPEITTIIRYHKSGNIDELKNALHCLQAMQDCVVVPFITAQDLSEQQVAVLESVLSEIIWRDGVAPRVAYYSSPKGEGDLRSKMLNESLRDVKTRYAAFLDYDDRLMSNAYSWLIGRLKITGKAIAFGRVFCTEYDGRTGLFIKRKRDFEYGYSYRDFIDRNHAPVHSFVLDLHQLDLDKVVYFDDHKYMEDYFLMLQIVTEDNADWEGLNQNIYIGDYVYSVNRLHTLAISTSEEMENVLADPDYIKATNRINDIRKFLVGRTG